MNTINESWYTCCQIVKDKDFESNSQPMSRKNHKFPSCCQIVKDKDFESNSQQKFFEVCGSPACCQIVKDKDFESNSQPNARVLRLSSPVVRLSKIKISKAIHNA